MRYFLKSTVYLIPIIALISSLISIFIDFNYVVVGNSLGYSLLIDIALFYHFYYGKYCWFTKLSPIGLFFINTVDIIGYFYPKYYSFWYTIIIFSVILSLTIIMELNKIINK